MMDSKMPKFLMLLSKKAMSKSHEDNDYGMDEAEMEDEPGGYEREGMRIAAADLIQAVRSGSEIKVMDALETFMSLCKKG